MRNIREAAKAVERMDKHLRNDLLIYDGKVQKKKLWEHTYIKHQIDRRKKENIFSIIDHIRAMVYSMLSGGIVWERVENGIDEATGKILPVDEIFREYDVDFLLQCNPDDLANGIKKLGCASYSTWKQMRALISINIPKLIKLEKEYSSIDSFYQKYIDDDASFKTLVKILSDANSKNKMGQMGVALNAEYLKNTGYNIAKPDRHIKRILDSRYLACSESENVPPYEAIDIVKAISEELGKTAAEVDYILWSYCATGFGEICTAKNPKCKNCIANQYCNTKGEKK